MPQEGESSGTTIGSENVTDIRNDEGVQKIAAKHKKSVFEIVLRWGIQRGCAVIPKASQAEHQRLNLETLTFSLDEEEMAYINSLGPQF